MKNLLTACLPVLALFALGGCASTSALTSSEDDGVYYSSKDHTTAVVRATPAPASASEEANPDYNGGSTSTQQGSGTTQYYDNTYSYMRGMRGYGSGGSYYGSGLSGYSPYSPYSMFGYGWGSGASGYSPYGYGGYDPFYSSYGYSPYYGYGSGLSISFGFGQPYYGGYGYSPYGYGYGYSPYNYGGSFYGGYYGRGGYYGNNYGGGYYGNNYNGGYGVNGGGDNNSNSRTYGHRTDRASEDRYNVAPAAGAAGSNAPTGGHMRSERLTGNGGQQQVAADGLDRARRNDAVPAGGSNNQPQRTDDAVRPRYRDMEAPVATDPSNGRTRADVLQPQGQPTTAPQDGRRRGGFFQNVFGEPAGNNNTGAGQAAGQPRQRTYEQPRQQTYEQPQRSYSQPQPQRSYSQPQPQRSYSQPQPQRSYSQPSYGGGNSGGGGGGNSGGGGGGGRRGRN